MCLKGKTFESLDEIVKKMMNDENKNNLDDIIDLLVLTTYNIHRCFIVFFYFSLTYHFILFL